MATGGVNVVGLTDMVSMLKGPKFKNVNFALREVAGQIAADLLPHAQAAVRQSAAPQADVMAATFRVKRDRVPILALGRVNPRFTSGFTHKGESAQRRLRRRGQLAHGVVYGPKGGRPGVKPHNPYKIPRDESGGPLGAAMKAPGGRAYQQACEAYLRAYLTFLTAAGFDTRKG